MSPVKAKGLDHVAIAVKDLEKAIAFYEKAFGLKLAEIEEVKEQKVRTAIFGHGLGRIELICPTEPALLTTFTAAPIAHHRSPLWPAPTARATSARRSGCRTGQRKCR